MKLVKLLLLLLLLLFTVSCLTIGRATAWEAAPGAQTGAAVVGPRFSAASDSFIRAALRREAGFHRPGISYDTASGLTYDGFNLLSRSPRDWSAASKEALHLSLLALALQGNNDYAELFVAGTDTDSRQIRAMALDLLRKKLNAYEEFDRRFPGYGGFLPWWHFRGQPVPTDTWSWRVPSLDNGLWFFALYGAARVLKENGDTELAAGYRRRCERLAATAPAIFLDTATGSPLLRTEATISDTLVSVQLNRYGTNLINGHPGYLNDDYEGVLFRLFFDFFTDVPDEIKDELWHADTSRRTEYQIGETKIPIRMGFRYSAHELWPLLQLPIGRVPLAGAILRQGEIARADYFNRHHTRGLAASVNGADQDGKEVYVQAGIPDLATAREVEIRDDIITPYAAFPLIVTDPEVGLAWWQAMLEQGLVSPEYGALESLDLRTGTVWATATFDVKGTAALALAGGTGDLIADALRADGLYARFVSRIDARYRALFSESDIVSGLTPALPPAAPVPTVVAEPPAANLLRDLYFQGEGLNYAHDPAAGTLTLHRSNGFIWANPAVACDLPVTARLRLTYRAARNGTVFIEFKNRENAALVKTGVYFNVPKYRWEFAPSVGSQPSVVTLELREKTTSTSNRQLDVIALSDPSTDLELLELTVVE